MLPRMKEIDDLNCAWKMLIGDVPDPRSAIADDDFGCGPFPASAESFCVNAVAEFVGVFDSTGKAGGIRIANGPPFLIDGSLRKHGAELALAGAGALPLDSADPALGFRSHHGDLDAIHQHIHFRDDLFDNNGQDELFGAVNIDQIGKT